ncbi:MAG: sialidase family protein [Mycobacteriales bacterium]
MQSFEPGVLVRRRPLLSLLALTGAAGLALAAPSSAAPAQPRLVFGKNSYAYTADYGEPGLAIAPDGTVYASTPGDNGAVLARSDDKGRSWVKLPTARSTATQAALKGGDSDVVVARDGTVYAADLNVDGITVFRSTDKGRTFPQQAFINGSADREWLAVTGAHGETVHVVWHELATGTMLGVTSTDGAKTFGAPEVLYSNPQTAAESLHDGTAIGGVSVDDSGRVYVSYATSRLTTTDTTYGTPPVDTIKMSVRDPETGTWTDHLVNAGADDANYGNFWMASAVDRGGDVYAVYSGYAHKGEPMHVWLQQSSDHGVTWTPPFAVDTVLPGPPGQDLFGWVAGGGKGVAVVSWYHTAAPNKDADGIDWVVPVAQVRELASGHPSVVYGLASDHSVHHGPICTLGTFCGILPGSSDDRSLLDFFKVAVGPDGMPAVVWSDNNRVGSVRTGVGYARQVGGPSAFTSTLPAAREHSPSPIRLGPAQVAAQPHTSGGSLAATGLPLAVPGVALLLLLGAALVRRTRLHGTTTLEG